MKKLFLLIFLPFLAVSTKTLAQKSGGLPFFKEGTNHTKEQYISALENGDGSSFLNLNSENIIGEFQRVANAYYAGNWGVENLNRESVLQILKDSKIVKAIWKIGDVHIARIVNGKFEYYDRDPYPNEMVLEYQGKYLGDISNCGNALIDTRDNPVPLSIVNNAINHSNSMPTANTVTVPNQNNSSSQVKVDSMKNGGVNVTVNNYIFTSVRDSAVNRDNSEHRRSDPGVPYGGGYYYPNSIYYGGYYGVDYGYGSRYGWSGVPYGGGNNCGGNYYGNYGNCSNGSGGGNNGGNNGVSYSNNNSNSGTGGGHPVYGHK